MSENTIWDILIDSNRHRTFDPGDTSHAIELLNRPLRYSWKNVDLKLFQYEGEGQKPLADFMSGFDVPAVSAKAEKIFRSILNQQVEFLPLRTEIGDYFALNVKFIDCLDVVHSAIERAENNGSIIGVDNYAFFPDRLVDINMFRIPQLGLSRLFVSDLFKEVYEENQLTGLIFYRTPMPK